MDYVLLIPPPLIYNVGERRRNRDFDLSLENALYCCVALLFKLTHDTVQTDKNELQDVECTMIEV